MSTLFAAIVPVTRMSGRLEVMHSWLRKIDSNIIEVILVHDNQDASTGKELNEIIQNLTFIFLMIVNYSQSEASNED
jgi:hypothetical protein